MTMEQALAFVDIVADIAAKEIERSALDADHWERRDYLAERLHKLRYEAAGLLAHPNAWKV